MRIKPIIVIIRRKFMRVKWSEKFRYGTLGRRFHEKTHTELYFMTPLIFGKRRRVFAPPMFGFVAFFDGLSTWVISDYRKLKTPLYPPYQTDKKFIDCSHLE